jgi:hypothetical protein
MSEPQELSDVATPAVLNVPDLSAASETTGSISAYQELTIDQLASVHSLLSPDHAATLHDILITAALEALRSGPLSEVELVAHAVRMWPGTGVNSVRINAAMRVAANARYVVVVQDDGQTKWGLSRLGTAEVQSSRDWARDILEGTARQVQEQLRVAGRVVSLEEARLWTTIVRHALMTGIAGSFAPYTGDVQPNGEILTVRRWNQEAIRDVIDRATDSQVDAELILGLAINAFDPLTPFGSELVTTITVGYMLHAFVGRRDRSAARAVVGSLNNERAILDTPVLLRLLGAPELAQPIERVISAAIASGMEVVAPIHYIEELQELLASVESDQLPYVQHEISAGLNVETLGSLVDDQVLGLWLRAAQSGRYKDWAGFRQAAASIQTALEELGVMVRAHYNQPRDNATRFEVAVGEEIARNSARPRRKAALERDGETMAMAHRKRTRTERAFWPGAWIITTDTRIGPAYHKLHPGDPFPLTLTPAAWVSIVSNCSPPAEVEKLAEAASQLFSEEGFMTIAARFPVRTAVEIARALGPSNGGSSLDVRVAQGIDQLLRTQPDYDETGNAVGAHIAAEVVARRGERLSQSYASGSAQMAQRTARILSALVETERKVESGDADRRVLATELETARAETAAANKLAADTMILERRKAVAIVVGVGLLAVVLAFAYSGLWLGAGVAFLSLLFFARMAADWVTRTDTSWKILLVSLAIDALLGFIGPMLN